MATPSDESAVRVVFVGANKNPSYVVESYPVPHDLTLKEGEILVNMKMATICEDDLKDLKTTTASGLRPLRVLGHEGVGEVVCSRRPRDGDTVACDPGDRIVFAANDTCGKCEMCCKGFLQRCSHIKKYGQLLLNSGLHGTFSQHIVISAGTGIAKVPSNVPNILASSANCGLANMMHVIRSCNHIAHGKVAVIQGCNMSGLYLCALLHNVGFQHIFCHDVTLNRLRLVQRFHGIPENISNNNDANVQPGYERADVIVNVDREVGGISSALKLLAPGGTYIVTATETSRVTPPIDWALIAKKSLTIKGITGYTSADLESAMEFLSTKASSYPFELLFGPVFNLQDFPAAILVAEKGTYLRVPILIS